MASCGFMVVGKTTFFTDISYIFGCSALALFAISKCASSYFLTILPSMNQSTSLGILGTKFLFHYLYHFCFPYNKVMVMAE